MASAIFRTLCAALIASSGLASYASGQSCDLNEYLPEGITFAGSYEAGYSLAPLSGESASGSSSKQRLTLNLNMDLDQLVGWEETSLFFQYQHHNGVHGNTQIHDIQQYDGLDDPEYSRIHMLWLEKRMLDDKLRVKVGKVEPKSEFFAPENARNHLGFSTERSPTILAQGPPSMSLNMFYKFNESFTLAYGLYDAAWNEGRDENTLRIKNPFNAPADLAMFLEGRYIWGQAEDALAGGIKIGTWQLKGDRAKFGGGTEDSTSGMYLTYDQTVTPTGIGVYAQLGTADDQVSNVDQHFGAGLQWVGPFETRTDDVVGFGLSRVEFSDATGAPFTASNETALELFYKSPVTDWVTLQADLQQIDNPGGLGADDALVATVRATFHF